MTYTYKKNIKNGGIEQIKQVRDKVNTTIKRKFKEQKRPQTKQVHHKLYLNLSLSAYPVLMTCILMLLPAIKKIFPLCTNCETQHSHCGYIE